MTKKWVNALLEAEALPAELVGKRLLRKRTVLELLGGISDDTLSRLENLPEEEGPFPRRFRLQAGASKWSAAVWVAAEVFEWLDDRAARRGTQSAA
jgi:predicted DNA-binding transcriptional regulator AlpA